jgi:hypothetical protein
MSREWIGDGPGFSIEWGGRTWTLNVEGPVPGLRAGEIGPVLGLEGIAATGRWDRDVLSGASLLGVERRFGRVEATYAPTDWGRMFVRAAWGPSGEDGVDLEVQLHALSVDELKAVEVKLLSTLAELPPIGSLRSVAPRDARAAILSYDGREADLAALHTGPPGEDIGPWLAPRSGIEGWTYVEIVHPDDLSRRVHEGKLPFTAARTGLFGHDLERGVVLRGRVRGLWFPKDRAFTGARDQYDSFLREPPPLTT